MLKWIGVIVAVWIGFATLGEVDRQFGLMLVAALAIGLYLLQRRELNALRDELKTQRDALHGLRTDLALSRPSAPQ